MRILGWLAMILGVVGLVISLVVAVGVWVVKPSIDDGVTKVVKQIATEGVEVGTGDHGTGQ